MKLAALALIGCSSAAPPPAQVANAALPAVDPGGLEVRVAHLGAWEEGASYRFTIHRDGAIDWQGIRNVRVPGVHRSYADRQKLDHLEPALDLAQFAERDASGRLPGPPPPDCDDATHVVIEVHRGFATHKVDFTDGCTRDPAMVTLVELLDDIAGSATWR